MSRFNSAYMSLISVIASEQDVDIELSYQAYIFKHDLDSVKPQWNRLQSKTS